MLRWCSGHWSIMGTKMLESERRLEQMVDNGYSLTTEVQRLIRPFTRLRSQLNFWRPTVHS